MDVSIGDLCGALLNVVVVCATASAEEPKNVGKATTAPMTESGTVGTMTEAPRGCIGVSYSMSADGHQWNEYAQNRCLRNMHCNTTLYLKGSDRRNWSGTCNNAEASPGYSEICSNYNNNVTWAPTGGTFSCHE
jgi:hypothetical protein